MSRAALPVTMLLLGVLLGIFMAVAGRVTIDTKLTVGDVANALVTLLVAVALQVFFQRNFSADRVERDLLIEQTREVASAIKAARETFVAAYTGGVSVEGDLRLIAALRNASLQLTALERASEECDTDYRSPTLTDIRALLRRYRRLLTERAMNPTQQYSTETYGSAEAVFGSLSHALLKFSVHVNRA
jgi:hypothetical protein